ncbi:efflux RND transporter periplasmic adaptor subunit [Myxococcota bacterium]|nr:efflux RND transporter periplasmic adaptor subunit [Myxococcota bacterium]
MTLRSRIPLPWSLLATLLALSACAPAGAGGEGAPPTAAAAATAPEAPRTRVEVARIEATPARIDVSLPGEVEGIRDAILGSPAGGPVEAVLVRPGQAVKKGQAIARVDTASYQIRREQAAADLALAEAELERARAVGDGISPAQLQAAEIRARIARAGHEQAELALARSVVSAPFAGTVASVDVEVGEIAPPGARVARLVQLQPVRVKVSVADRDMVALVEGMDAKVTTEAIPELLDGKVVHVSPAGDLKTRAFEAEIEVSNPGRRLLPGMIANVRLARTLAEQAVVLPQDVLVTRLDGIGVFVEEQGVARWRPLTLGQVVHDQVIVTGGLAPGERVVTTGHRELADGDRLLLAREGVCCTQGRVDFAAR